MKIHEYQARELLEQAGVPVPGGIVVDTPEEAGAAFEKLASGGATLAVVKAQVHAGGRGKGGGVKLVKTAADAKEAAATILSKPLVTPQTGSEGVPVNKLLIAAGVDIEHEYYLGIVVDRALGKPVIIASTEGGMAIEEVAEETPDAILKEPIDPVAGLRPYQATKLAFALGFKGDQVKQFKKTLAALVALFLKTDASLAEINPLVKTPDGQILAIDAKIDFDDNAKFRQKALAEMEDPSETPESEQRAEEHHLSYIQLDGNIGCLVNGAGLAMSTMDTIQHFGGSPANFLDVGGGASQEAVTKAFRIILSSDAVKGIFVNIFGGIMKCDIIANGVVAATKELGLEVPLVVRLEGTNVEEGKAILRDSGLNITPADTMAEGAQKIVELAKG
ncbi:MAG: ADP-forming succinate--CoA ligase subunit beta [Planctomycetota bacterium]